MSLTYGEMQSLMLQSMGLYAIFWTIVAAVVIFVVHRRVRRK